MSIRTGVAAILILALAAPLHGLAQGERAGPAGPAPGEAAALQAPRGLHESIGRGDYVAALRMIEGGADPEAKDAQAGASALHFAVMNGRMPVIDLLLSRGANVNSRTRNGTTPLHTAVLYARMEVAEMLLDNGAEIDAASISGATPLALAKAARNQPVVQMLLSRGARDTVAARRLQRQ